MVSVHSQDDVSVPLPDRSAEGGPIQSGSEITIVGGGVVGLSVAWEAVRRGLRVTVLEKKTIGEGTSWTAAGILPPANWETATDPVDRLRGLSHSLHPVWAAELLQATGIDNGLRRCGGIYLATSVGEAAALVGLRAYWQEYDIAVEALSMTELVALEPSLTSIVEAGRVKSAYRLPDEYQIRSPDHLAALRAACELEGVEIVESICVDRLDEQPDHIGLQTAAGKRTADAVVVTAGAWSSALAKESGFPFDIIPVRGQVLMYHLSEPPFRHVVNEGNRYFVPREDGHLLIGSCEEEVGWTTETTPSALAEIQHWGEQVWPGLKSHAPMRSWAGLRPSTVDGFPYIGKVPQSRRTFVATGHFRSGIHLSCGSAVLIVDALMGEPPKMDLDPFRIGRG
ncbi:Glycine oxidase [Roseimaritima multifibrata]|uniref:Glycine oxidase n=1 Tax=Roseimaritima multifibrata TaxID=1930274 RepID=A0A517MLV3_9BACT|nr:glycine oxidase ThiO [Roseimaritima multifibrata]QDS95861.1 Glycine oxidase [Roseimaritima multifibrata]